MLQKVRQGQRQARARAHRRREHPRGVLRARPRLHRPARLHRRARRARREVHQGPARLHRRVPDDRGQGGRLAFTLAHEGGHWYLHRPLIEMEQVTATLFGKDDVKQPTIFCRSSQKKAPAEWQADRFAAALLMPAADVRATVRALCGDTLPTWEDVEAKRKARVLDEKLRDLATEVMTKGNHERVERGDALPPPGPEPRPRRVQPAEEPAVAARLCRAWSVHGLVHRRRRHAAHRHRPNPTSASRRPLRSRGGLSHATFTLDTSPPPSRCKPCSPGT
ncbi:MAG: ImmA/IrrE family metallo-endopeptidase [Sandaracinaceae bacterium]|nr:ImmA/IrrE family metallo-endopeptidase [Sandaracinaceae bacterium]